MIKKYKVVAISGSTREHSTNLNLIHAIQELYTDRLDMVIAPSVASVPHFNPDWDTDTPPQAVRDFRKLLQDAEGILICTPEYAMGVPGSLKNAIDWTVSSMEFSRKPTALITASSVGQKGHRSLLETLHIIEADIPESSQLLISHVKTKVKGDVITDETTLTQVKQVMDSLIHAIIK
ncbi:MAG TPA: NADPH-dependent FMN reductase [Bacteroidia bacterium]|nr:NADPH-dependent FMN reductase [Bacteroidia bacterium]